jgi:Flp pilus assembly protein TadB
MGTPLEEKVAQAGVKPGRWKVAPRDSELRRQMRTARERGRVSRADLEDYYENGAKTIRWWGRFIPRSQPKRSRRSKRSGLPRQVVTLLCLTPAIGLLIALVLVVQRAVTSGAGPLLIVVAVLGVVIAINRRPRRRRRR